MRYTFLLLLLLQSFFSIAQNHVGNNSFEQRITCPRWTGDFTAYGWYNYTHGSPDFLDSCAYFASGSDVPTNAMGYQQPLSGGAYAGIATYYRWWLNIFNPGGEYIATPIQPLIVGKFYEVSMSVSLSNKANYASDGLGVLFYSNYPDSFTNGTLHVPRKPQIDYSRYGLIFDTTGWVKVKGYLLADSSYHKIVIGQFKDTPDIKTARYYASTTEYAYYYIDDVVVKEASNLNIEFDDSTLCAGDTILVGCRVNPIFFNIGNIFNVELSDSSGSFSSPVIIGTITSKQSDTIKAVIPSSAISGNKYRVRLSATMPTILSDDNGFNIKIGNGVPNITSYSSNSPVCLNDSLIMTATSNMLGVEWYWWRPYQYPILTNKGIHSRKITAADTGVYIVAASNNGCLSQTDTIKVYTQPFSKPFLKMIVSPGLYMPPGTELNLIANKDIAETAPSYKWTKNGMVIAGAMDSFYKVVLGTTFAKGDVYCVEMTSSLPCPNNKVLSVCYSYNQYSSANSVNSSKGISIYPNPVDNFVTVEGFSENSLVEIYDIQGRKMYINQTNSLDNKLTVDMSGFVKGIYVLTVTDSRGERVINKITKN